MSIAMMVTMATPVNSIGQSEDATNPRLAKRCAITHPHYRGRPLARLWRRWSRRPGAVTIGNAEEPPWHAFGGSLAFVVGRVSAPRGSRSAHTFSWSADFQLRNVRTARARIAVIRAERRVFDARYQERRVSVICLWQLMNPVRGQISRPPTTGAPQFSPKRT